MGCGMVRRMLAEAELTSTARAQPESRQSAQKRALQERPGKRPLRWRGREVKVTSPGCSPRGAPASRTGPGSAPRGG